MLKILGIDPGTIVTGYGILSCESKGYSVLDYGCIRPPPRLKLTDRYLVIYEGIQFLLEKHQPSVLVVETQFVRKNPQSAIKLGMARGVVILAAKQKGLQIVEYPPAKAKKAAVGNGRASKRQVQLMMQRLLLLDSLPEPEDAADALALAFCHAQASRYLQLLGTEI